jgi:hypothetical protein
MFELRPAVPKIQTIDGRQVAVTAAGSCVCLTKLKMMTSSAVYLIDEIKVRRSVEITVNRKVTESLPRGLVGVDVRGLDGLAVGRNREHVVPHGRGGHHGDAGHGTVAKCTTLLQRRAMHTNLTMMDSSRMMGVY